MNDKAIETLGIARAWPGGFWEAQATHGFPGSFHRSILSSFQPNYNAETQLLAREENRQANPSSPSPASALPTARLVLN